MFFLLLDIPSCCNVDWKIIWLWTDLASLQIFCIWLWELISWDFNWTHEESGWYNLWFPILWHWTFDRGRGQRHFFLICLLCRLPYKFRYSYFWSWIFRCLIFLPGNISCSRSCFSNWRSIQSKDSEYVCSYLSVWFESISVLAIKTSNPLTKSRISPNGSFEVVWIPLCMATFRESDSDVLGNQDLSWELKGLLLHT